MDFHQLDLEALAFGPARVHAQKHVRPVLAFRAAGAGMHFQIGVVAVGLAGQHGFHLAPCCFRAQGLERRFSILDDIRIALFLAELDELDAVAHLGFQRAHAADGVVEVLALAHQLLRFAGIVPKRRVFRLVVQPVQSSYRLIPVKDASSAGLWPA